MRHSDWLRLIDVSGPFIGLGVLAETFPLGLDADEPKATARLRRAYVEWEADRRRRHPDRAVHRAWTMLVLRDFLEYEDGLLAEGPAIPDTVKAHLPEQRVVLRPDFALARANAAPVLLVNVLPPGTRLERPQDDGGLHASPAERMRLLLRGAPVRSGLLTNGDQWMLVHQPPDRTATFVTWESEVLVEEPEARRAFRSLLGVRRLLGVADTDTLDGLFERSRDDEREVTDQLGAQTRRAVELLVAAIDCADREAGGKLLAGESLEHIYEAAVVVAMRVIFMLAAEARGLMPEEEAWLESYAITPLREQLQAVADRHGPELLDRRFDAWPRLLAAFRAVHGGVAHERIRLPGYGGGLFNPSRYAFLEGAAGAPLRISNRVMLHVLDALQTLEVDVPGGRERRPLSFRALGVEQIGHVYEGLLDHEAVRTTEPALGLVGTSNKEPEIALPQLERARDAGAEELLAFLREQTGRSESALRRALESEPDPARIAHLRAACDNDQRLIARVLPFLALVRDDSFGLPTVFLPDALYVTVSTRRRATGTHYTPPSLTEPIVRYALEPLVYRGPAEGREREQWELKPASELLTLKVCDIAMGSGAFLVATCRYLAARLVEAWGAHRAEAPEGIGGDPEERTLTALRLVAERCVYGVDKNPLAVEIAKVSLWLITLRKDRPFTFVDHALRCGDSLIGLTSERQLRNLSMRPEEAPAGYMLDMPRQRIGEVLARARELRERIEFSDAIDLREVQEKLALLAKAAHVTRSLRPVADLVVGATLTAAPSKDSDIARALVEESAAEIAMALREESELDVEMALMEITKRAVRYLHPGGEVMRPALHPFHWVAEFPEVFTSDEPGFDAVVGNPPFLGGKKISGELGGAYREYLTQELADNRRGNADLVAFFFLRAAALTRRDGGFGLIATNTVAQGDTRDVGLDALTSSGWRLIRAMDTVPWPGEAGLYVSHVWGRQAEWKGGILLQNLSVGGITPSLDAATRIVGPAHRLAANRRIAQQGSNIVGDAFFLDEGQAQALLESEPGASSVVKRCLGAAELTDIPSQVPHRWALDFTGLSEDEACEYSKAFALARQHVYPDRAARATSTYPGLLARWWQYWNPREELYNSIRNYSRVLVGPRHAKWWSVCFVSGGWVYSGAVIVFTFVNDGHASVLSSTLHDAWARRYSGSLTTRLRYSPTDCFENFPFPASLESLDEIGDSYLSHRKATMLDQDQGLTTIYNRVNEHPEDQHTAIVRLRELRCNLDRAVADAYGWQDLELVHDFRKTPLGLRYTIDEATKTEALDRLLELNHERYAEEAAQGLHAGKRKTAHKRRSRAPKAAIGAERLFSDE